MTTVYVKTSKTRRRYSSPPSWPYTWNKDSIQSEGLVLWVPLIQPKSKKVLNLIRPNHGTSANSPTWLNKGGMQFNGANQYVNFGALKAAEGTFGYMCWFKTSASGFDNWMVAEGSTSNNNPVSGLIIDNTKLRHYRRATDGTIISNVSSAAVVNDNEWHHGAVGTHLFIDGVQDNAVSYGDPSKDNALALNSASIGALRRASVSNYFQGQLKDVRIYKGTPSAEIIKAAYGPSTRYDLYHKVGLRTFFIPQTVSEPEPEPEPDLTPPPIITVGVMQGAAMPLDYFHKGVLQPWRK